MCLISKCYCILCRVCVYSERDVCSLALCECYEGEMKIYNVVVVVVVVVECGRLVVGYVLVGMG